MKRPEYEIRRSKVTIKTEQSQHREKNSYHFSSLSLSLRRENTPTPGRPAVAAPGLQARGRQALQPGSQRGGAANFRSSRDGRDLTLGEASHCPAAKQDHPSAHTQRLAPSLHPAHGVRGPAAPPRGPRGGPRPAPLRSAEGLRRAPAGTAAPLSRGPMGSLLD